MRSCATLVPVRSLTIFPELPFTCLSSYAAPKQATQCDCNPNGPALCVHSRDSWEGRTRAWRRSSIIPALKGQGQGFKYHVDTGMCQHAPAVAPSAAKFRAEEKLQPTWTMIRSLHHHPPHLPHGTLWTCIYGLSTYYTTCTEQNYTHTFIHTQPYDYT